MYILNENPKIFTTGTCPLPLFVKELQEETTNINECVAMDKDVFSEAYLNFLRQGFKGWFESMTDKQIVISKSRLWQDYLPHTFKIDKKSKYIVLVRDLRDIVCSFDNLLWKYPNIKLQAQEHAQLYTEDIETRINVYFHPKSTLGMVLNRIPHVVTLKEKYPDNFLIIRHEDLNSNPYSILEKIYVFLELDYFKHDLQSIQRSDYIEHDTVYRDLVSHKVDTVFKSKGSRWDKEMSQAGSEKILSDHRWFYDLFYPEYNSVVTS